MTQRRTILTHHLRSRTRNFCDGYETGCHYVNLEVYNMPQRGYLVFARCCCGNHSRAESHASIESATAEALRTPHDDFLPRTAGDRASDRSLRSRREPGA